MNGSAIAPLMLAALCSAACRDPGPCATQGAEKDEDGVCDCPPGSDRDEATDSCVAPDAGASAATAVDGPGSADAASARLDAAKGSSDSGMAVADSELDSSQAVLDGADATFQPSSPALAADSAVCTAVAEVCDGKDNDCDGNVDEAVQIRCWLDGDGDGFAPIGPAVEGCDPCGARQTAIEPSGASTVDCDDRDRTRAPGATDICGDNIDNDCDGKADEEANNACGGACTAQLAGRPGETCSNGLLGSCARTGMYECQADRTLRCSAASVAASAEICDGMDNDCDGMVDEGLTNECGTCGATPGETCDGQDNDCDGQIDEGVKNACGGCGALPTEVCDGVDNDCDGSTDEAVKNACGDCGSLPSEACDGVDNDCDGSIDENFPIQTIRLVDGTHNVRCVPAECSGVNEWSSPIATVACKRALGV